MHIYYTDKGQTAKVSWGSESMNGKTKIKVQGLGYAYEGSKELFNNVSFTIRTGEIICILGPNGIGKTTLLNCIANLITPTKGEILINDKNINKCYHRT